MGEATVTLMAEPAVPRRDRYGSPAQNPYVAGNPVRDPAMFFGRARAFGTVRQCLLEAQPAQVVVLHGQRRVGKTSTLYQMGNHLPEAYTPVLVDLQLMPLNGVRSFLEELIQVVARDLERAVGIPVPTRDPGTGSSDAGGGLHRFFDAASRAAAGRHIILMLDETALLTGKAAAEGLEDQVFAILSDLVSRYPFLDLMFAVDGDVGPLKDQISSLPRQVEYYELGFLEVAAARALIREPVRDVLEVEQEAVESILALTSGQPYYTQLVCRDLFRHMQAAGRRTVGTADVEAVCPGVIEAAAAQLRYVWDTTPPLGQHVLLALAETEAQGEHVAQPGRIGRMLLRQGIMAPDPALEQAIDSLQTRQILDRTDCLSFCVGLFRHWILEQQHTSPPLPSNTVEAGPEAKH